MVAAHVRRWLPAAARPRRIALVAALPLTPTGKLDRATLLETLRRGEASGDDGAAAASDAPADALERKVAATWAEVLGAPLRAVTRRADFVRQGGDSIKALQLARTLSVQLVHPHEKGLPRAAPTPRAAGGRRAPRMPQNNAASRAVAHAAAAGAGAADYGRIRGVFSPIEVLRRPSTGTPPSSARRARRWRRRRRTADDDAAAADVAGGGGASSSVAELQLLQSEGGRRGSEARLLLLALALGARHGSGAVVEAALALGADPAPRPARLLARGRRRRERARPPRPPRGRTRRPHAPRRAAARRARAAHLLSSGGVPPLHLAAEQPAALDALDALLGGGAPLAMRDGRRQTALHSAARAGNVAAIGRLLAAAAADLPGRERSAGGCREPFIELRDRWHRTALHWAVVNGEAAAAALVAAGAAVNGVPMSVGKHLRGDIAPARGANPFGGAAAARRCARPRPHPRRRARRPAEGRPVRPDGLAVFAAAEHADDADAEAARALAAVAIGIRIIVRRRT